MESGASRMTVLRDLAVKFQLWPYRTPLYVVTIPLFMIWLPLTFPGKASLTGYVMLVMGLFWVLEVLPLAVTALLPVIFLPLFGILTIDQVCFNYMKDLMMLFIGGLMVAISIEKCNLHRRMALGILCFTGGNPKWLMLGFMLPTWFLSMWISNTATTAMMLPIANAVLVQLEESGTQDDIAMETGTRRDTENTENGQSQDQSDGKSNGAKRSMRVLAAPRLSARSKEEQEVLVRLSKGLTIGVAYAANVGGLGTLIGTGPNLVLKGVTDSLWKDHHLPPPLSFGTWFVYGFPASFIMLCVVWLWLQILYLRSRAFCWSLPKEDQEATKNVILQEYKKLGPIRFAEAMVTMLFALLVLLWFFREPHFIAGWGDFFPAGYTEDAIPAIAIATILFFVPQRSPYWFWRKSDEESQTSTDMLLDWKTVQAKMPWGLVLLMGGGFALAQAATTSGLSLNIANQLQILEALPDWLMITVLCFMVAIVTEFTSNAATCTLLMPIVAIMAENAGKNPLYLMFPVAISTSFAFMLPVGTPPNAIAFATGRISVVDMMISGSLLNVLCVLVVVLATQTWGMAYFNLNHVPWSTNATSAIIR